MRPAWFSLFFFFFLLHPARHRWYTASLPAAASSPDGGATGKIDVFATSLSTPCSRWAAVLAVPLLCLAAASNMRTGLAI